MNAWGGLKKGGPPCGPWSDSLRCLSFCAPPRLCFPTRVHDLQSTAYFFALGAGRRADRAACAAGPGRATLGVNQMGECTLQPREAIPVDGNLFGVNSILGPIVTLAYDDPELLASARAIGAGVLRYPGGSIANFWDLARGRYHEQSMHPALDATLIDRVAQHPERGFIPTRFWAGVASASAGATATGPVWVLNVHTMSGAEMLAQVDALHSQARVGGLGAVGWAW